MTSDLLTLSAAQLLQRRVLFKPGQDIASLFKQLMKRWHPDQNSDPLAKDVAAHVSQQYAQARRGEFPNTLTMKTKNGPVIYTHLGTRPFELGDVYICPRDVIWRVRPEFTDLVKQFLDVTKKFNYPNDAVRDKIAPFLPRNVRVLVNPDYTYLLQERDAPLVRCADIIANKGPLHPKHVGWIMSRAYNLAGYLHFAKMTHLDISTETLFIDPATHLASLLGGWFYSGTPKIIAAPARSAHLVKAEADQAHGQQIRALGMQLLNAKSGVELRANKELPPAMRSWLMGRAGSSLIREEEQWKKVLTDSFGPRKFTVLDLKFEDVYT